jgi:hypothetical protein
MDTINDAELMLTRREAAGFLRERGFPVSQATLATLVSRGGGPRYFRFGPRALYKVNDLLDWAAAKLSAPRRSTAEADRAARRSAPASPNK